MTKNENEEDVVEMDEVFKKHILARYGQEGLDFYDISGIRQIGKMEKFILLIFPPLLLLGHGLFSVKEILFVI